MNDRTARLALPLIIAGQAQKEVFHNEALARIDIALNATVESASIATPPEAPQPGQCWIVAPGAAGEWAGQENQLASWTESGWRFLEPHSSFEAWDLDQSLSLRWNGSTWDAGELRGSKVILGGKIVVSERQPHVPSPSGGSIIDAEARASLNALIATLMSHGLID